MAPKSQLKVALVMRSFLDYRIPVFAELFNLLKGNLWVLYSRQCMPERVRLKLEAAIGEQAIGFDGELSLGYKGNITTEMANQGWRIPYQPGIIKRLKQVKPDIIVGDGLFQWTWQALYYHLISRRPLVLCYERTAYTERHAQWYRKYYRKVVLRRVSAMAVNGKLTKEYVESMGFLPESITEGQMAADTTALSRRAAEVTVNEQRLLRAEYMQSPDSRIYLTIGQLIRRKGIDKLLMGWQMFQEQSDNQDSLLILGEGPEKQQLIQLCKDLSVTGVHFLGAVNYESIYRYYVASDWFVMPTLEDNWSLVVPEAMACGLPILCSRYNGCWPELVHDDVNGWVFDPLDSKDLLDVFNKSSNVDDLSSFQAASKEIVKKHTPENAARAIMDACLIASRKR